MRSCIQERKAFFDKNKLDSIFNQKLKRENFIYDNRPRFVENPEVPCQRKITFGDHNLPDAQQSRACKRKITFIDQENLAHKKQKIKDEVKLESEPLSRGLALDVLAPIQVPGCGTPLIIRKAKIGMQLELSPTTKETSPQPIRSGKKAVFFTFSPEHIALSSKGRLDIKLLAYKQKLRQSIEETEQLIEQFSPGYIQRKRANPFPKVSPEELEHMIAASMKRTEEARVRTEKLFAESEQTNQMISESMRQIRSAIDSFSAMPLDEEASSSPRMRI